MDVNAIQSQGPAWVALCAIALAVYKGAWPYYKRVSDQARTDRRADLAECAEDRRKNLEERRQDLDRFMQSLEKRDSGYTEAVTELAYLSEIIIQFHSDQHKKKPPPKAKR